MAGTCVNTRLKHCLAGKMHSADGMRHVAGTLLPARWRSLGTIPPPQQYRPKKALACCSLRTHMVSIDINHPWLAIADGLIKCEICTGRGRPSEEPGSAGRRGGALHATTSKQQHAGSARTACIRWHVA